MIANRLIKPTPIGSVTRTLSDGIIGIQTSKLIEDSRNEQHYRSLTFNLHYYKLMLSNESACILRFCDHIQLLQL